MEAVYLVFDVVNKTLVSYNGSATALPPLYQRDNQKYKLQFVKPSGDVTAPFTVLDKSASLPRVTIGPTPTGTAGSPTPYTAAYEADWTWNATDQLFEGSVNNNTTAMQTAIGTGISKALFFEVKLVLSGVHETVYSHRGVPNVTVFANEDEQDATFTIVNLVPSGAIYDGGGNYTLSVLTIGADYQWIDGGANDTGVDNDGNVYTDTGHIFTALDTFVTLTGTPGAAVTALVQTVSQVTTGDLDAIYMRLLPFAGSPEGVVTALPPQIGYSTDTGQIWIKRSGTGNTGWQEIATLP